jgi:Activator of Hsp90 ATPase homolog 1-like protein
MLHYAMIADAPEQIAAMQKMGRPTSCDTRGRFTVVEPHRRLAIAHLIDFLPGVKAYESAIAVEFFPAGDSVRMVVTMEPMHDEEFTRLSVLGLSSQLRKLDKRFR